MRTGTEGQGEGHKEEQIQTDKDWNRDRVTDG